MTFKIVLSFIFILALSACSSPMPKPVAVTNPKESVSYLKDVKPILDKRCVVCHSCYNSPCQAKYSSFEGIDRGASKLKVYDAMRLRAQKPTRLFIDARSTQEWREKGFFTLTQSPDSNTTHNDSLMIHLLHDKKIHPEIIGEYAPEKDDIACPRNKDELADYLDDKPYHGMPYGFPAINEDEYKTLASWLLQGAKGPSPKEQKALVRPSKNAQKEILKFEKFLNTPNVKHQVTARYLYEHLYLGHIYFTNTKGEFFSFVRSYTPTGVKIQKIPTVRVFDDPKVDIFYYRFEKIHSTIVHKTHMTLKLDEKVLQRYKELFIDTKWAQTPHKIPYDVATSTNPFLAFEQIPVRSRYQFLLDNAHYIIMNFIRGPVCRGQMALNVIQDHFWVMFRDPSHDISVLHPELIHDNMANLALPIATRSEYVYKVFSDEYRERYKKYYANKQKLSHKIFPKGMGLDSIWKGNKPSDSPLLTIYRHFDSASVHKGVLGAQPRTMWVIDYAQFERIYYNLVAGYDVFGNVSHQTNIRRYMDFLRVEGELNFLEYMPKKQRLVMFKSWYLQDDEVEELQSIPIEAFPNAVFYTTKDPEGEFVHKLVNHHILKSTDIHFDKINYISPDESEPVMPKAFKTKADIIEGVRAITRPGSGFISYMTDQDINNMFLKLEFSDGTYVVKNLVVNRWHDNVNSLFPNDDALNPKKDTMDILDFSIGSYPNVFIIVQAKDLPDFLDLMKNMTGTDDEILRLKKYFISRSDPDFWNIYDWFQAEFFKRNPVNAGLYDLNRYVRVPWEKTD